MSRSQLHGRSDDEAAAACGSDSKLLLSGDVAVSIDWGPWLECPYNESPATLWGRALDFLKLPCCKKPTQILVTMSLPEP